MKFALMSLLLAGATVISVGPAAMAQPAPVEAVSEARLAAIARESYDYLYPLVIMDVTRRVLTSSSPNPRVQMRAPMNHFYHMPTFPDGAFKDVVRPNFDTLYSTAWLDVSKEPIVLSVGDLGGRYFMVPLLDMWSDVFAVPGSETTRVNGGTYVITAPGWKGTLPAGAEKIEAPTPMMWIIGRIQTNGPADYEHVRSLQQKIRLTPLSRWGKPDLPTPPLPDETGIDVTVPPLLLVNNMSAESFFDYAMMLMAKMPAHNIDQPMLARMRMIGLVPGLTGTRLPAAQAALAKAKTEGPERLTRYMANWGVQRGAWQMLNLSVGSYGSDYMHRAAIAMFGLGANRPADAIYPRAHQDSDGKSLDGSEAYVIRFKAGELPPANAFWSLTAYDQQGFTVPNALNRYALGDRDPLKFNADGSLDIYVQPNSPGAEREANWLPVAPGKFSLSLRLYLPRPEALDGRWVLPTITRSPTR